MHKTHKKYLANDSTTDNIDNYSEMCYILVVGQHI